jgi:hypothetical protein
MFVIDLDIAMDEGDPMSCFKFVKIKLIKCNYTAVVKNQFVAFSAMFTGVVPREQLNRLDLQVIG